MTPVNIAMNCKQYSESGHDVDSKAAELTIVPVRDIFFGFHRPGIAPIAGDDPLKQIAPLQFRKPLQNEPAHPELRKAE